MTKVTQRKVAVILVERVQRREGGRDGEREGGREGAGGPRREECYRSAPQSVEKNRAEHPVDCGRSGRNTLCTLMPLGCKVLPFSI